MKVQDKIFLHPNHRGEVGANWITFPLTEKDECYLRKDALLEWAKEQASITEKLNGKGAMLKAWDTLIGKLNSM